MRTLLCLLLLCYTQYATAQCTPVITPAGNTTFCDGNSVTLNASFGDTYQWYKDGNIITGAQSNSYVATTAGNYTVEIDSVGCINMSPAVGITVNTVPAQPGPISGNTNICCNSVNTYTVLPVIGATSYVWYEYGYNDSFSDTTSGPSTSALMPYPQDISSPAATLTVRSRNECGVSDTSSLSLAIYSPVEEGVSTPPWLWDITSTGSYYCPEYGTPEAFLYADYNAFSGNAIASSFEWFRNGSLIPNSNVQKLYITRGGSYYAKIHSGPCVTVINKGFISQCLPRVTIYPQNAIDTCLDSNVTLSVVFDVDGVSGTGYNWRWYLNGVEIPGSQNIYSITPIGSGRYSVEVGVTSCPAPNPANIQCNYSIPYPVDVTIPPPLEVTQTDDTLFATPGYDTYQWFESGNLLPGETDQKLILSVDGFYTVEGVFMNGCVENSASFDSDFMPPPPPPPPGSNNTQQPGEQMTISPNPVTNSFVLSAKVAQADKKATIIITDAMGRVIMEKEVNVIDGVVAEKIDLQGASATVGTVKLRSAGTLKTARFFKK